MQRVLTANPLMMMMMMTMMMMMMMMLTHENRADTFHGIAPIWMLFLCHQHSNLGADNHYQHPLIVINTHFEIWMMIQN